LQGVVQQEQPDTQTLSGQLHDGLVAGDMTQVRTVVHGAYAAGLAIEELGDDVVAPAMAGLGHDWQAGRIDVMHEHRATLLCTAVLHDLKPMLELNADADRPVAAGGSPEGDPSLLASLLVQMVLLEAGWEAINLGANTPMRSFRRALSEWR